MLCFNCKCHIEVTINFQTADKTSSGYLKYTRIKFSYVSYDFLHSVVILIVKYYDRIICKI